MVFKVSFYEYIIEKLTQIRTLIRPWSDAFRDLVECILRKSKRQSARDINNVLIQNLPPHEKDRESEQSRCLASSCS